MMKRIVLLSICFCLLLATALPVAYASALESQGGVYEFVVKPNSSEWKKLKTTREKIAISQVPVAALKKMSTRALVETVMNYPLLVNIVAFDTKQEGFNVVYGSFNGLQELTIRNDAVHELKQYQTNLYSQKQTDNKVIVKEIYVSILIEGMSSKTGLQAESLVTPYSTSSVVYTPKGTAVATAQNSTWADHGLTASEAAFVQADLEATYPNATVLSPENPSYNCHSFAWYSSSYSNTHWMNSPYAYMSDGSWKSGTGQVGSRIYYGAGDHSGIVTSVSGYYVTVKSKWSRYGVFSHNYLDCPYTAASYTITFWN